jgi:hypothetical protein
MDATTCRKQSRRRFGAVATALVLLAGCTDFGDPIPPPLQPRPASVTITAPGSASAELAVGATLHFAAVVLDDHGQVVGEAAIGWESSAPGVASIDSTGVARGVDVGSTDVTATFGALRSAAVQVSVRVGSVAVVRILGDPTHDVAVGAKLQLQAEARDVADNLVPDAPFVWSADDARIASVDSTGMVQGLAAGQTAVRAASGGVQSDSVLVRVLTPGPDFARDVQPIFDANCVLCHGFDGNLNLGVGVSYDNLVGVQAFSSALLRVAPGNVATSYLYVKLTGPCPGPVCNGRRMPQGAPSLPAAQLQVMHDWITAGAPR